MRPATSERPVLVVEDDLWARTFVADLLTGEGYAVVQASNGVAGLRLAERHAPSVILLDLALPELPGAEVLRQLKGHPATRDIPVVVVSGLWAWPAEADAVVPKPFSCEELLAEIRRLALN